MIGVVVVVCFCAVFVIIEKEGNKITRNKAHIEKDQ
jgi:hypothetical protein